MYAYYIYLSLKRKSSEINDFEKKYIRKENKLNKYFNEINILFLFFSLQTAPTHAKIEIFTYFFV